MKYNEKFGPSLSTIYRYIKLKLYKLNPKWLQNASSYAKQNHKGNVRVNILATYNANILSSVIEDLILLLE